MKSTKTVVKITVIILIIATFSMDSCNCHLRLSIGDIIKSWGTFIGPYAIPKGEVDGSMALGNTQTCDFAGFVLFLGTSLILLYLLLLIYFFWRRVKHKVSEEICIRRRKILSYFSLAVGYDNVFFCTCSKGV